MAIRWRKRPGKDDLMRGVEQWVINRAGIEHANFDYLHQLTINDLTLMAIAMGFKPDEKDRERLQSHYKWKWESLNRRRHPPVEDKPTE